MDPMDPIGLNMINFNFHVTSLEKCILGSNKVHIGKNQEAAKRRVTKRLSVGKNSPQRISGPVLQGLGGKTMMRMMNFLQNRIHVIHGQKRDPGRILEP